MYLHRLVLEIYYVAERLVTLTDWKMVGLILPLCLCLPLNLYFLSAHSFLFSFSFLFCLSKNLPSLYHLVSLIACSCRKKTCLLWSCKSSPVRVSGGRACLWAWVNARASLRGWKCDALFSSVMCCCASISSVYLSFAISPSFPSAYFTFFPDLPSIYSFFSPRPHSFSHSLSSFPYPFLKFLSLSTSFSPSHFASTYRQNTSLKTPLSLT